MEHDVILICRRIWEIMNFQLCPDHYSSRMDNFINPLPSQLFLIKLKISLTNDKASCFIQLHSQMKESVIIFDGMTIINSLSIENSRNTKTCEDFANGSTYCPVARVFWILSNICYLQWNIFKIKKKEWQKKQHPNPI